MLWNYMVENLSGKHDSTDQLDAGLTGASCMYVELMMLPADTKITRTSYEAKKPNSEGSAYTKV